MKNTLHVATADGDVEIDEDDRITNTQLAMLGMSRKELHRCFAEGVRLMKEYTVSDRVRPVAEQNLDGSWEVRIVKYSPLSDPLMQKDEGTKQ